MTNRTDRPVSLCSDCSYRAKGPTLYTSAEDGETCDWCGTDLNGRKTAVEEQDDPGPLPWQQNRDELFEWLASHPHTSDVRKFSDGTTIDFTIGDMFEWPEYGKDDHINAVRSSSINLGGLSLPRGDEISEVKIHLPPASDDLKDAVEAAIDVPESFHLFHGTMYLGVVGPPPDGLITPHLIGKNTDYETVRTLIEQCLECYAEVYEEGAKVRQTHG